MKQVSQNSVSSLYKQGQQHGHRKNLSSQLENKNIDGSPRIGNELKYLLTPSKAYESPIVKKGPNMFDNKLIKQNSSITRNKNLIIQTTSQSQISANVQTLSSTRSNHRTVAGSPLSNMSSQTCRNSNTYDKISINQVFASQVKEYESAPISATEQVNKNRIKQNTTTQQIAQTSKLASEIPQSYLNFNLCKSPKNLQDLDFNQVEVLDINNNKQTKGQEILQIPIGQNKIQQHQSFVQINIYNSKFSQSIPQNDSNLNSTAVNTQPVNNNISQIIPIEYNFLQQQQQNQDQMNLDSKNVSLNQNNHQQLIYLQSSPQKMIQPNYMQIDGATMTESQNNQNIQNPNKNAAFSQSSQTSKTNISNFVQNDQIKSFQNKDEVQDQVGNLKCKYQRSISREYSVQNEPLNILLKRKESSPNQGQSRSRNNSQSSKINNKTPVLINTGANNQLSIGIKKTNSQDQIQNLGKINPNISILQNQAESRKNSAVSTHLGIKNANIKLSSLTNSQSINSSISQAYLINPNQQTYGNQQCPQPSSPLNNTSSKCFDSSQQAPTNFKSQLRQESLIAFQMPQQIQISKQSSSTLFVDIEESSLNNQAKMNHQISQNEQIYTSPSRDKSPRIMLSKERQKSIQDFSNSVQIKQYNKRYTDFYPLQKQQISPSKSFYQMGKLNSQSQQSFNFSSIISQKAAKKNKRNTSYSNLPSDTSENIKTFLRFRPNNNMELDLNNQGIGQNVINFIDNYSVALIGEQQQVYTVDKIFKPNDNQETIYSQVGEEVIYEVFLGYNGTIFTYGVTGSGKTHTMFGNITDSIQKGIIPRICNQIFDLVENDEEGTEFIINCSMLEIYKEILYDSIQEGKVELKIKENAQKGIYVQGLTQTSVANQDELFQLIKIGYNTKRTRETRLNEYSSRSHTIFMIEIQQRLSNGDEKVGKINLIDLAGAEKVSRSGAQGESLEEAIKINLSLSCLGKVIHALTSGNEYIPYRDSKLTRILQESLGGNYKTSLIVTCSMHSSFQDDTISSLKFATRAKTIKNTFKMNIKMNPINLQKELDTLKIQTENYKYMLKNIRTIFLDAQIKISSLPNISSDPKLYEIIDSVCKAEKRISAILQEKKHLVEIKFEDYLKEKLQFSEIVLADYFKNSINFNFEWAEKGFKDVQENFKKFNLEADEDFMAEKSLGIGNSCYLIDNELQQIDYNNYSNQVTFNQININKNGAISKKSQSNYNSAVSFACNLDSKIFQNENNEILKKIFAMPSKLDMASASETVSNDFIIVSLKKQLIDTHILNQNLLRTINALEWKQKKQIKHLEKVLEEVTENHKELKLKIEDLEFDMYQQYAQQMPRELSLIDNNKLNKSKIIIPLTPQNVQRQYLLKTDNKTSNFDSEVKLGNFSKDSLTNISTIQKEKIDIQQSFKETELDIIPLTYENALDELKKRNNILKKIREINIIDFDSFEAYASSYPQKETDDFVKNERERLNNKIVILQQELKMEQVKVESIKHSLLVERKNVKDLKQLTENMEVSLRNTLKEENDSWQQTINEITELNKVELTKRQAEYNQLREIFFNIIEYTLQKIQEMKGRWQSQEVYELENIIIEMEKAKLQIGKYYENVIKKISINSSMQYLNPQTQKADIATNSKHS
ncbi:hypothetical protein ABPG72_009679 [Tetrahymena utriculariae]